MGTPKKQHCAVAHTVSNQNSVRAVDTNGPVEKETQPTSVWVTTCTANELLFGETVSISSDDGNKIIKGELVIPEYQRPYRWQIEQIKRLLDDISEQRKAGNGLRYYMGSAILHNDGNGRLNIIDGQQRITTLALLGKIANQQLDCGLQYSSPVSQRQIKENLQWLVSSGDSVKESIKALNFDQLEFTLVVTDSEDSAYSFFETQNTGGVRLSGPDIIKAHHLRAVQPDRVPEFALQWESMGDLTPVVDCLLRGRYWRSLSFRDYPRYNQPTAIRTQIVCELAERTESAPANRTGKDCDIAYARALRTYHPGGGETLYMPTAGYELRQPLNSGVNTINYLLYFEQLRRKYLELHPDEPTGQAEFTEFYHVLIRELRSSVYLKRLYDACLLMYISQFGEYKLYPAAVKMFRVVYSRRVQNRKTVREDSVTKFVKETPVLDWIASGYTAGQCMEYFDGFDLKVNEEGLGDGKAGVKNMFVTKTIEILGIRDEMDQALNTKDSNQTEYAEAFSKAFSQAVRKL